MYYDRRIPDDLIDLLLPGGALGWLLPWLSTDVAQAAGAHVQTRRNRHDRKRGGIQLYVGRTSPLEVRGRPKDRVRLHADRFYTAMAPDLFDRDIDVGELGLLTARLEAHAEHAAKSTHSSFVDGEAVVHAGLMRAYGPLAASDAAFQALDSEARVGFDTRADQVAFEASLPDRVGLPTSEDVPRKLDVVAVDRDARLLLVEVKADAKGMTRAAWQAAVHVARFRSLVAQHPQWFGEVLADVANQKKRVGLLAHDWAPSFGDAPQIAPVVAAPDPRDGWQAAWRAEIEPVVASCKGMLDGLRMWRLSEAGLVLKDVVA